VRGWWTGDITGSTDVLGGEFAYRYADMHYSKQKITELIPGEKVVWTVLDGRINFVDDKDNECFNGCTNAWMYYINDSLRGLIARGASAGRPAGLF
jgi:hypothetical protein